MTEDEKKQLLESLKNCEKKLADISTACTFIMFLIIAICIAKILGLIIGL